MQNEWASNKLGGGGTYVTCTEINEFTSGYQSRSNSVKDENGFLLADSQIFNMWRNFYSVIGCI
jgi:hypothetical protein